MKLSIFKVVLILFLVLMLGACASKPPKPKLTDEEYAAYFLSSNMKKQGNRPYIENENGWIGWADTGLIVTYKGEIYKRSYWHEPEFKLTYGPVARDMPMARRFKTVPPPGYDTIPPDRMAVIEAKRREIRERDERLAAFQEQFRRGQIAEKERKKREAAAAVAAAAAAKKKRDLANGIGTILMPEVATRTEPTKLSLLLGIDHYGQFMKNLPGYDEKVWPHTIRQYQGIGTWSIWDRPIPIKRNWPGLKVESIMGSRPRPYRFKGVILSGPTATLVKLIQEGCGDKVRTELSPDRTHTDGKCHTGAPNYEAFHFRFSTESGTIRITTYK